MRFLNVLEGARDTGPVADLNPRKPEMYVPGTGQSTSAPAELARKPPELVVTLDLASVKEIGLMLGELRVAEEIATSSTATAA